MGPGLSVKCEVQLHHLAVGVIVGIENQVADQVIVIGRAVIEGIVVQIALADADVTLFGIVIGIQLAVVVQALAVRELEAVKVIVLLLEEVTEVPLAEGNVVIRIHFPNNITGLAAALFAGADLHNALHVAAAADGVGGKGQFHRVLKVKIRHGIHINSALGLSYLKFSVTFFQGIFNLVCQRIFK